MTMFVVRGWDGTRPCRPHYSNPRSIRLNVAIETHVARPRLHEAYD